MGCSRSLQSFARSSELRTRSHRSEDAIVVLLDAIAIAQRIISKLLNAIGVLLDAIAPLFAAAIAPSSKRDRTLKHEIFKSPLHRLAMSPKLPTNLILHRFLELQVPETVQHDQSVL